MTQRLQLLGLLALLPVAACYSYRTIPVDDLRPDLRVRLRVTPAQRIRTSVIVGYVTDDVEGQVIHLQDDTLLVQVPAQTAVEGGSVERLYQRVDVPLASVLEAEQRHFSPIKTYALAAVGTAGAVALAVWTYGALGTGSGDTKGGINNQLIIPLGHLMIGR